MDEKQADDIKIPRLYFWMIFPFCLFGIIGLPFALSEWDVTKIVTASLFAIACACLLLGFYNSTKFKWAFRVITAIVLLATIGYLVSEFYYSNKPIRFPKRRSESNPINAVFAFLVFGLPSLKYLVTGKLSNETMDEDTDEDKFH